MVEWGKSLFVYPLFVNRESLLVQDGGVRPLIDVCPVLSLRTILRSCEQESEAIPSKAAAVMNNVRDSSPENRDSEWPPIISQW